MRIKLFLQILFIVTLSAGCSQQEEESQRTQAEQKSAVIKPVQAEDRDPKVFLSDPIPLHRLERTSEALAIWRRYSELKPSLLLLGNDPMLVSAPEELVEQISETIKLSTMEDISRLSNFGLPKPLFLPRMTVDLALREGWFSQFCWAFPMRDSTQDISLELIADRFEETGIADEEELASLQLQDNVVQGTLRGVPLRMSALPNLPLIDGPVIIHIDQSYFRGMYKNDIATPLLKMVGGVLDALQQRKLQALAVTFDNGNFTGGTSLDVRFLQHVLARSIEHPETLDQPAPVNWQRKADILYLSNFFKKDETRELALAMDAEEPETAWIKFTLYRSAAEHNQGSEALSFLSEAVRLDPVYAVEYLALADMAFEKGRADESMRMLSLAARVFPENIQIKLRMARLATEVGEKTTALHLVEKLQQLEWSPVYYPEMPDYLEDFAAFLKGEQPARTNPADDPRRQRILK